MIYLTNTFQLYTLHIIQLWANLQIMNMQAVKGSYHTVFSICLEDWKVLKKLKVAERTAQIRTWNVPKR